MNIKLTLSDDKKKPGLDDYPTSITFTLVEEEHYSCFDKVIRNGYYAEQFFLLPGPELGQRPCYTRESFTNRHRQFYSGLTFVSL